MGIGVNQTPLLQARLRDDRKLSQRAVAEAIEVDQSYYCKVETGRKQPSPAVAERIAKFFGYQLTEEMVLYPQRFMSEQPVGAVCEC